VAQADTASNLLTDAEAMACQDAAKWDVACEDKRRSFERMGVYEIISCPKDRKVVGSKWVFQIKWGLEGSIQKYKACVVAQGFSQVEGLDYDQTFIPVAKFALFRAALAIAAKCDWEVHQMDVKATYLNGRLEEEIFMKPPPEFDIPEGMVLKLIKAVYGTKQGGQVWYEDIRQMLREMGYEHIKADHAVFIRNLNGVLSIIILYIDDITMAGDDLNVILQDKKALQQRYQMTDLGEISWILGIHVT
jgi:hypothetical protein